MSFREEFVPRAQKTVVGKLFLQTMHDAAIGAQNKHEERRSGVRGRLCAAQARRG